MSEEAMIGLWATKAAIKEYRGVNNVPVTMDMVRVKENSHQLYTEHMGQEQVKKDRKKLKKIKPWRT